MQLICYDKLHYEKFADGSVVCIEDEIPFKIPENWAWCRLEQFVSILNGDRGKNYPSKDKLQNKGIPFISAANIDNCTIDTNSLLYMTEEQYSLLRAGQLKKNDILYCIRGSLGKCGLFQMDSGAIASSLVIVRPYIKTLPIIKYVLFYLTSEFIKTEIYKYNNGTAQPNLAASDFAKFLIPLPPQSEQARISSTVQELLEIVETVENDKIDLSELIKQTKAKVLDLAIKGKLVPQDSNDEPADKLLEKIREEKENLIKEGKLKRDKNETFIFKNSDDNSYYEQLDGETVCIDDDLPFEIPDSWRWCRLKDIGTIVGGGTPKTEVKGNWENGNIPWLTPADMRNIKSKYVKCGARNITLQGYNSSSAVMLSPNSIVYSSRAPIGYVAITRNCLCTNQGFKSVDLYYKECSNYAYYLLKALTTDIVNRASGTTFKEISGSEFGQTFVPLPPLNEQIKIGENIDSIFGYLDKLETIIKGS